MYPLNMTRAAVGVTAAGFAVANDDTEHQSLTAAGYEPKFVAPETEPEADSGETKADVMAALDAAGIAYDKRNGLAKLKALLPAE